MCGVCNERARVLDTERVSLVLIQSLGVCLADTQALCRVLVAVGVHFVPHECLGFASSVTAKWTQGLRVPTFLQLVRICLGKVSASERVAG